MCQQVDPNPSQLVNKPDLELERLLLEEEIVDKQHRLTALAEEIEQDEQLLEALRIVVPWWNRVINMQNPTPTRRVV